MFHILRYTMQRYRRCEILLPKSQSISTISSQTPPEKPPNFQKSPFVLPSSSPMKGPTNPAPLPPPLYTHYALDRRPNPRPDFPDRSDRRPVPLDRRAVPAQYLLDRRALPPQDLIDRRGMPPQELLDRRAIPPQELIDRRAMMAQSELLDRRAMLLEPELMDHRRMVAPVPDGLERRTIALSDGQVRTYFALPPDPPPFARAYNVLDQGGSGKATLPEGGERERSAQRHGTPSGSKDDRESERSVAGPSAPKRKHEQDEARASKRERTCTGDKEREKDKDRGEKGKAPLEVDRKALLDAFLKMSKTINESSSLKRDYLSEGRNGPLRCIACTSSRRELKGFVDMNALLMHAYNVMNPELLVNHRALHKALCVLMGRDPSAEPTSSRESQKLSPDQAQANRDDLVLWPPMVVIQNTNSASKKDGRLEGMGNKEMDAKLLGLSFTGVRSKALYGREGHQGVTLVRFSENLAGLKEAERLSELFEKTGQGHKNWILKKSKDDNRSWNDVKRAKENNEVEDTSDKNPNLVKEYGSGEKRVLYGYLATASDLEILDSDAKKRASVRSRKESDFPDK